MRDGLYLGGAALPFISSLRVYLPLSDYAATQKRFIDEHLERGLDRINVDAQELSDSLGRISRANGDPLPTSAADRIRTLQFSTTDPILYAPNQIVVRSLSAVTDFYRGTTAQLAQMLVPDEFWESAKLRAEANPGFDSSVQTRISSWGIPFSWFVLIHEQDRTEVVEAAGRVLTVRVQVPLPLARERAASMLKQLAESAPELELFDELDELHHWLEGYSQEAAVELDYGPVANRVYPDESPADVRMGLECLAEGDLTGAAAAYRRLAARWIPVRQLARAS